MEIYLNMVMILNFLVILLLLLGTNRMCGFFVSPGKCLLAAAFGGLYAGICLVPGMRLPGTVPCRLVSLLLMALLAFGWNRGTLRRTGLFLFLATGLGILSAALQRLHIPSLLLCCIALWLSYRGVRYGSTEGERFIPVSVQFADTTLNVIALRDTGNTLRDPITGEPVLVLGPEPAEKLLGLTRQQLADPLNTMTQLHFRGLRLIPYHTVSGCGLMLAMRFSDVRIGCERKSALIAFAPHSLGEGTMYQALTGGAI